MNALVLATIGKVFSKFTSSKKKRFVPGFVKSILNVLVPAILFNVLSPGNILTLPPKDMKVLFSGMTSRAAIAVHTVVFALVYSLLRVKYSEFY